MRMSRFRSLELGWLGCSMRESPCRREDSLLGIMERRSRTERTRRRKRRWMLGI